MTTRKQGLGERFPDSRKEFEKLNKTRKQRITETQEPEEPEKIKESEEKEPNALYEITESNYKKGIFLGTIEQTISLIIGKKTAIIMIPIIILTTIAPLILGILLGVLTELKVGIGFGIILHILSLIKVTEGNRIRYVLTRLDYSIKKDKEIPYKTYTVELLKSTLADFLLYSIIYIPIILTIYLNIGMITDIIK